MDKSTIDLHKTLLLYFIFKEQDVRKTVKAAQLQHSHQFSVDNLHRRELTVHSIDILTQDPSVSRIQTYVKNIEGYSYTKTRVSVQMLQRVQPKTSKFQSSIITIHRWCTCNFCTLCSTNTPIQSKVETVCLIPYYFELMCCCWAIKGP